MDELESDELEAALLEAGDDVANESTLDTVGLQTPDTPSHSDQFLFFVLDVTMLKE